MRTILVTLGLAASASMLAAQSGARPLPRFTVYDVNSAAVDSSTFASRGRVVLVYVRPDCRACDQLLGLLAHNPDPAAASRLLVVVLASVGDAAAFAARTGNGLGAASWYADPDADAWNALGLEGLPVMMGVGQQRIGWTFSGAPDRRLLESAIHSWLFDPEGER